MEKVSGVFFFFAGVIILLGILTAEIFYPTNYSISLNMISNLAATPPPDSIIRQPSATIFDISLIVAGILIILGINLFPKKERVFTIVVTLMGAGTLGVGVFPAFHVTLHPVLALIAFLFGGISAIVSCKTTKPPFSLLAAMLGVVSLCFLIGGLFFPNQIIPVLGKGGTERFVLYPLVIWLIGFGSFLMNTSSSKHS